MYCLAWKYTVSSDHQKFEQEFGRNGSWFKLFEPCEDYLGHELMKGVDDKSYLVTNKWMSREDYERFIAENREACSLINKELMDLYDVEEFLGNYHIIQ